MNLAATPRRDRLSWPVEIYVLVIRGEITEDEADRRTATRAKEPTR